MIADSRWEELEVPPHALDPGSLARGAFKEVLAGYMLLKAGIIAG